MDAISIAVDLIKPEENFKRFPYTDQMGNLTIGYGLALYRHGLPEPLAALVTAYIVANELAPQFETLNWYNDLDPIRQAIILDMAFQIGVGGVFTFKTMIACLTNKDYDGAADNLLKSLLAKQAPARTQKHAKIIRTGQLS
jgi:lysozyme